MNARIICLKAQQMQWEFANQLMKQKNQKSWKNPKKRNGFWKMEFVSLETTPMRTLLTLETEITGCIILLNLKSRDLTGRSIPLFLPTEFHGPGKQEQGKKA